MVDFLKDFDWKKTGIFAAGVAFGTAGIKVLSSKDAKKFYTNCTAAALRMCDENSFYCSGECGRYLSRCKGYQ